MTRIAEAGHIHFDGGAGEVAAGVRHGQPHQAGVAHPDAGRLPGAQRLAPSRKTCNFANDATEEYVEEIYRLAYQLELQGRHGLP